MSVTERIQQIQECQRKAAEAEAARVAASPEVQEAKRVAQKESAKENKRKDFVKSQTEKIIKESGLLAMLQQIESGLLKAYRYHGISRTTTDDIDRFKRDCGRNIDDDTTDISLAWSNEKPIDLWRNLPQVGCYKIRIEVNPDSKDIRVIGRETRTTGWQDRECVENTIAEAYLNPLYDSGETPWSLN